MPHTESAKKRLRQSEKRRLRNRIVMKSIKKVRKAADSAIEAKDQAQIREAVPEAIAKLDRAAAKGYIHPNKAARLKSRMAKKVAAATSPSN